MAYLYSFLGEFFGTALLIILGNGVVANAVLKKTLGNSNKSWVMISLGWGFAVFVAVFVAQAIGGTGYINPAVAIWGVLSNVNSDTQAAGLAAMSIPVSVLGAMFGQVVLYFIYLDAYKLEEDHGAVLGSHCTGPAVKNHVNNFMTEFLATLVFVGAIASIGQLDRHDATTPIATALSTLPVALLVLSIGLSLGGPTGYAINPARDLGPRIIHQLIFNRDSNWAYSWVPVFGPFLAGTVIGIIALIISIS